MDKPIKPIYPNISDKKKYPMDLLTKNSKFHNDYKQYQKDLAKYKIDFELWQQTKFIEDVQRSSLKLCLKKYKIIKT